ncbi:Aldehyde/histidinol dehydrogenase [Zopfochytrium polystomum]|nr:Aldehyde/histidinol dehydrogenase [Zopfochytrium polystomum]
MSLTTTILSMAPSPLQNYIDGANVALSASAPSSTPEDLAANYIAVTNPATGETIAYTPKSKRHDVDLAVAAAEKAFEGWSNRTVKDRAQVMIRFHQLVVKHQDELADLIVMEHGKNRTEAFGDIAKGNETVEYAISLPQLIQGKILDVSRGVTCRDMRLPLGVVASIRIAQFTGMLGCPMWTLPIALTLGNTVVLKPSEKVPLTMTRVASLLREAGLPPGVFNIVHGGAETATLLCDHPSVKALTFVGTSHVAELLEKRGRSLGKRDIVNSFAGCSGQRCMAASVLLTVGPQPALLAKIVEIASALTPGQAPGQVGPVIDTASQKRILGYIDGAEKVGATVLLDGRGWAASQKSGSWVGPTVLLHKNKADAALHDEIFGPVLSVLEVASKEEAVAIENANPYGNAAAVYTSDGGVADWFQRRFSAGMIGVNIGVPVPREPFSFGGINRSKFGDSDITGEGAVQFFTYVKKVTTKWAPPQEQSWLS